MRTRVAAGRCSGRDVIFIAPPAQAPAAAAPPKNRLLAHAPTCSGCRKPMKVRTLLPGRKVDDVAYRCEECGEEVVKAVPRVW